MTCPKTVSKWEAKDGGADQAFADRHLSNLLFNDFLDHLGRDHRHMVERDILNFGGTRLPIVTGKRSFAFRFCLTKLPDQFIAHLLQKMQWRPEQSAFRTGSFFETVSPATGTATSSPIASAIELGWQSHKRGEQGQTCFSFPFSNSFSTKSRRVHQLELRRWNIRRQNIKFGMPRARFVELRGQVTSSHDHLHSLRQPKWAGQSPPKSQRNPIRSDLR